MRLRAAPTTLGETRLLLDIELEKGWKTYWRSPGEGGIAPEIAFEHVPDMVKIFWPLPQRFDVSGITTQGYHRQVSLPIVLTGELPATLNGILTLSTCSNVCILTDYPFSFDLTTSSQDLSFEHDFAQAMGQVPITHGLTEQIEAGYRDGKLQIIAQRPAGWQQPALFFDTLKDVELGKPVITVNGQQMVARVATTDDWGEAAPNLRGKMLSMIIADGGMAQEITVTIEEALNLPVSATAFWQWILIALAGGVILNLMRCVLPVLAMKLGSVLQVEQQNQRNLRLQFLASSSGILVSFWLLALLMTVLRLSNHSLGWGIQFQSPWFIGFMVIVTALFSANLFGLFEVQLSSSLNKRIATQGGQGMSGHFWQGALATLLATPCSAPFLGTAVAFALAAPFPTLWGIFTALGVGMSLPWLVIAAWPRLALCLPRPGRWMNHLRIVLGIMMIATSLWLLSLLANHVGILPTLIITGILLLTLLLAIWRRYGIRVAVIVSGISVLLIGFTLLVVGSSTDQGGKLHHDEVNWQPLTESAIKQALTENKRVFVDVTADWCVTCKVNKINVLMRDDVQQALNVEDVVALRGDWTRPSPELTEFLRKRGSVAVPFNQIYGPASPQGVVLSTLLNRDTLLQVLSHANGKKE